MALLPLAWEAGGKPECIALGDPLPELYPGGSAGPAASVEMDPGLRRVTMDLRQGIYARRPKIPALWRRAAIVAGAGLAAHGAIAAADTNALRSIAADRRAETRALVSAISPAGAANEDVASTAADMLPTGDARPGSFLPILTRATAALAPLAPAVRMRALSFDGALKLELEAGDPAALKKAEGALARAGLSGRLGEVVTENGRARGVIALRGPRA
jgi:general secretion pathway protein L